MERSKALAALAALANDSRLSLVRLLVQRGDQGMAAGTPFALAHTFGQTGPFRPQNVRKDAPGLVFAGSGTTPGVGIPMVLISGKLAADRVDEVLR